MSPTLSMAAAGLRELQISLGGSEGFAPGVTVLAGSLLEEPFGPAVPGLEDTVRGLYATLLEATEEWSLARIWNYVPAINGPGPGGLENYRLFCRGRSLAFERRFGAGFQARLPAASAVGCQPGLLTMVFAANSVRARHVENPLQVAAYDYPPEFGPRPPSFARATVVPGLRGATVFISGTAAIRGHATVAPLSPARQLDCTLENLGAVARACGLGPDLDERGRSTRHFKVYVRHAADLSLIAAVLAERLLVPTDRVTYVRADICRASLLVEIEASLFGVALLRSHRAGSASLFRA
jgi:hypothetical protein